MIQNDIIPTGRGFVVVATASSNASENYSELQSSEFQSRTVAGSVASSTLPLSITIKFWYYLTAVGETTLEVSQLEVVPGTRTSQLIVSQTSDNVGKWTEATAVFCLVSKDRTRIVFRLTTEEDHTFAAVDEIVTYRNTGIVQYKILLFFGIY